MDFLEGNAVEPFLEASETYPALESAIVEARQTVHMAYWTIDPTLGVISNCSEGSWANLIADTVLRGVTVRVVIADFDPILGRKYHRSAWSSYLEFMRIREKLPRESKAGLQVVCSRHEASIGTAVRILGQPVLQTHLLEAAEELNDLSGKGGPETIAERLRAMPGLWPFVSFDGAAVSVDHPTFPTAYPAAHHEKLCVIDDMKVFLGGLDLNDRRYDTADHGEDLAWHDVACRVEGPAASFFARHFRERWNSELPDFKSFMEAARCPEAVTPLPYDAALKPIKEGVGPLSGRVGEALVAPLRTMSRQAKSSFSRSPKNDRTEILEGCLDAIASARSFIYIETQFLRSHRIVEALIERATECTTLEILLLLPVVPEEILVASEPDAATKQGQYLQMTALERLREALGGRFGAFTLVRHGPATPDPVDRPGKTEEDIVYVHSKTMVMDDRLAIIGSANLNDRSLLTDTETAIAWEEPETVKRYRLRLWQHALDRDTSHWEKPYLAYWVEQADRNVSLPPQHRRGFVVPLPKEAKRAYSAPNPLIPPELV